jgi:CDP-glucose 4,6-dehydratase
LQNDSKTVDIRQNINSSFWQKIVQDFQPEIAFHLAAQPLVVTGWAEPELTFKTNVGGLVEFLSWANSSKSLGVAVIITSDKVYRLDNSKIPRKEDDPLGGDDPYSASKACAELVLHSWPKNSRLKIASARSGNVIGGGDWARDRLIPDLIREKHENEKFVSRNPKAIRPWQHVIEPISGYLLLAEKLAAGLGEKSSYNFGPKLKDQVSVSEIIDCVRNKLHLKESLKKKSEDSLDSYSESVFLLLDSTKANKDLGWKSLYSWGETISITLQWYEDFYCGKDPKSLIIRDINNYTALKSIEND